MTNKRRPGRICPRCKERESANYSSYCKPCASKRQIIYAKATRYRDSRGWVIKIRETVVAAKKKPCMDCGSSYPYYVMDFDHVRGEKKFNLSTSTQRRVSIKKVNEEISKCDIVCSNCHRARTFKRIISESSRSRTSDFGSDDVGASPTSESGPLV